VLETLKYLVEETRRRQMEEDECVLFKLLATDPGAGCAAERFFAEEEVLVFRVERYIDRGRQGGFAMEGIGLG
jgi:hypothetical protein